MNLKIVLSPQSGDYEATRPGGAFTLITPTEPINKNRLLNLKKSKNWAFEDILFSHIGLYLMQHKYKKVSAIKIP